MSRGLSSETMTSVSRDYATGIICSLQAGEGLPIFASGLTSNIMSDPTESKAASSTFTAVIEEQGLHETVANVR